MTCYIIVDAFELTKHPVSCHTPRIYVFICSFHESLNHRVSYTWYTNTPLYICLNLYTKVKQNISWLLNNKYSIAIFQLIDSFPIKTPNISQQSMDACPSQNPQTNMRSRAADTDITVPHPEVTSRGHLRGQSRSRIETMTLTLPSKIQRSAIVLSSAAVKTPARSAVSPAAALHRAISAPTRGLVTSPQSRVVPSRLAPPCSLQTKSSLKTKSARARQVQTRWNSDDASSVKLRECGFEDVCTYVYSIPLTTFFNQIPHP